MTERTLHTVVIGLGNSLMGDDGVGITALSLLRDRWEFEPYVEMVDGGTWGMNLLPFVEQADRLILIDAIHAGTAAGTIVVLEREELPRFFGTKISPHQIDLKEVLALAELRGTLPEHTIAIGMEPERVELSTELSPSLRRRTDALVERVVGQLRGWGHVARPKIPSHA